MLSRVNCLFLGLQAMTLVLPYVIAFRLGPGLFQGALLFVAMAGLFIASCWEWRRDVLRASSGFLVVAMTFAAMVILPNLTSMRAPH